jgi:sugar phosphate isomerase/epimerase
MFKVLSARAVGQHSLDVPTLEKVMRAGADGIEVKAFSAENQEAVEEHLRELARWFAANPLKPWGIRAPRFIGEVSEYGGGLPVSLLNPEKSRRIESMDAVKRAVDSAYMIPFTYLVLPLAGQEDAWSAEIVDHAITVLEHLGAFASQLGMKLLLESNANEVGRPDKLLEIFTAGRFRNISIALDTAEASLAPGLQNSFDALHGKLKAVYLSDLGTVGRSWPGTGSVNWVTVRELLRALPEDAAVVLNNPAPEGVAGDAINERVRQAFALVE